MENFTIDPKKPDKKQGKTLPVAQLQIVTMTEKDMSSVNGGGQLNTIQKFINL